MSILELCTTYTTNVYPTIAMSPAGQSEGLQQPWKSVQLLPQMFTLPSLCPLLVRVKGCSSLPERVCGLLVKYVSAFANHAGGHIYFGIADTLASVVGEEMNPAELKHLGGQLVYCT